MGTIKTTNIEPIADNGPVTLGSSGDTFTLGSGVVQSNMLYPAFRATMSAVQSLSQDTRVLVAYDTVDYDTDSAYTNTSSNYKFTVPSGKNGKYAIYAQAYGDSQANSNLSHIELNIYKNGSLLTNNETIFNSNYINRTTQAIFTTLDLNASDYIQIYLRVNDTSGSPQIENDDNQNWFGAYRIGT